MANDLEPVETPTEHAMGNWEPAMTPLDKAREALAAVEKATAGPLSVLCKTNSDVAITAFDPLEPDWPWHLAIMTEDCAEVPTEINAAAIVSAVNFVRADVPALIDSIERKDRLLESMETTAEVNAKLAHERGVENERLADRVAKLEAVLEVAQKQFAFYVKQHRDKGTPDGEAKALVNQTHVDLIARALLTPAEGAEDDA